MKKREKIKRVYQGYGIIVENNYLDEIIRDKPRVEEFMRIYKDEEINAMNYIFGKPENNKVFTKYELELVGKVDLFNKKLVELIKKIWQEEGEKCNAR